MEPEPQPIQAWKRRLAFLQEQEALVSDPAQKFTVREQIEEAQAKLRELAGTEETGPVPHLDLGRLPIPGPHFVGRETELARLDAAWEDPRTHVLTLVAFGGLGKSALVARWLDRMSADNWRGAARVLDWSFYSQGMEDRVTSAEPFIDHALRFFGDPDPKAGSLHDRGARLAHLIRNVRTLLVLDGIEPLQYPPGRPEIEGRLKDPGLAALLKGLAAGNPGLCVVTTRERIADLAGSPSTAPQIPRRITSPAVRVTSPAGGPTSPTGQTTSPAGWAAPPAGGITPSTSGTVSPAGRSVSPAGRTTCPGTFPLPRRLIRLENDACRRPSSPSRRGSPGCRATPI